MDIGKKETARHHLKRQKNARKTETLLLSLMCVLILAVGGTVAFLTEYSGRIRNNFEPSFVDCEVTENFDGTDKRNVNVKNTGDIEAYIRVKLVTYRVNDEGQHIGGTAEIPDFTPGENWKEYDGYYYYTLPVASGDKPETDLIGSITLTGNYNDADGGRQVIEVMAEAIQSGPAEAAQMSWGVSISAGSVTGYNG